MKARVKLALPGYTGNMDDMVIYYNSVLNCLIARKKVIPRFTPNNQDVKSAFALAKRIKLTDAFLDDCRAYIRGYNQKNRRHHRALTSWPAVWMKLIKSMLKAYPDMDIDQLTREYIISAELPCGSIATAVEAGYLEPVSGYGKLNNIL